MRKQKELHFPEERETKKRRYLNPSSKTILVNPVLILCISNQGGKNEDEEDGNISDDDNNTGNIGDMPWGDC